MIVALQCAKNFNPGKSKNNIRFSSYVSLPITSALFRMAAKSRSSLYVPASVMTKARKWSHTHFEMMNKDVEITDEDVSTISGVDMTQNEAYTILEMTNTTSIDEIEHPCIVDTYNDFQNSDFKPKIEQAIKNSFAEYSDIACSILGLKSGRAIFSSFLLSAQLNKESDDYDYFIDNFPSLLNHPIIRMNIKYDFINSEK